MADVVAFTDANFDGAVLKAEGVVLVEFYAVWCSHSRRINPLIAEIADRYAGRMTVGKLDVFEENGAPQKYRILSTPTVILFRNGEEIMRLVGSAVREGLKDRMEEILAA